MVNVNDSGKPDSALHSYFPWFQIESFFVVQGFGVQGDLCFLGTRSA